MTIIFESFIHLRAFNEYCNLFHPFFGGVTSMQQQHKNKQQKHVCEATCKLIILSSSKICWKFNYFGSKKHCAHTLSHHTTNEPVLYEVGQKGLVRCLTWISREILMPTQYGVA